MMDIITQRDIKQLINRTDPVCVSLFMPTHQSGRDIEQGPIRFKNLVREVEKYLADQGMTPRETGAFLKPAEDLLGRRPFWEHQSDGLAVFLSAETMNTYRVPLVLEERVVCGKRFHVKPLLPLLTVDGRFFILALSQNSVRLLQCTRYTVDEIDLAGIPGSLEQALVLDDPEKQLQFHTGTSTASTKKNRAAQFHGHGVGIDENKTNILRFFRKIDRGLQDILPPEKAPLVLAGVEFLFPIYREASDYPYLVEQGISGSPGEKSDAELHRAGWAILEPRFAAVRKKARQRFEQLRQLNDDTVSDHLADVVAAAHAQQVDTLFIARGIQRWGVFDPQANQVHLHEKPRPGDDELLDQAATQTLLNGGTVFTMAPEQMPGHTEIAALFRY